MVKTRSDIAFSIKISACFVKNSSNAHIEVVKIIFQYFKNSISRNITYKSNQKNLFIESYLDINLVRDKKS